MHKMPRFYDALPKRKVELVGGKMLVAGDLGKSAMMMASIIEGYGAEYVAQLIPKNVLLDAMAEVFGRPETASMADFSRVEPYFHAAQWVFHLKMSLWEKGDFSVCGSDMMIRLGENAFAPDLYFVKTENAYRQFDYFLDGAPDLIFEVSMPFTRDFDKNVRLPKYAVAGVPEIWLADWKKKTFQILLLENGQYQPVLIKNDVWQSASFPNIWVSIKDIFENPSTAIQVKNAPETRQKKRFRSENQPFNVDLVPFSPQIEVNPVSIQFQEFIAWGGEIKFEYMENKPIFGGGDRTTLEYLGLLLMTLGAKEAVRCLPKADWERVVAGFE
jgi:hypothetical protein